MLDSFRELWVGNRQEHGGWCQPPTYHIEAKTYKKGGKPNVSDTLDTTVPIRILALVIVPTKIVVGVCFPSYPIATRCPNVAMLL